MKFKTTIKLTTEAKDKNEAMEIAGEYLSGNLATGVDMRFHTVPVSKERAGLVLAVLIIIGLFALPISHVKNSQSLLRNLPGDSAIQPPLKTYYGDKNLSDFKKEWQSKHAQEALDSLKR